MLKELHHYIESGQTEKAVALIKAQPELLDTPYPPELDPKEGTPLHQAIAQGGAETITALLRLKPKNPNRLNGEGKTALALSRSDDVMIFMEAVNAGCLVDPSNIRATNEIAMQLMEKHMENFGNDFTKYFEALRIDLAECGLTEHIPNINKNPKAFCGYLLTAAIADSLALDVAPHESYKFKDIPPLILEMIQKQGMNWEKNLHILLPGGIDTSGVRDTVNAFNRHVMQAYAAAHNFGHMTRDDVEFHIGYNNTNCVGYRVHELLLETNIGLALVEDRSISEILAVSKAYHRARNHLLGQMIEIDHDMVETAHAVKQNKPLIHWPPMLPEGSVQVPATALDSLHLPKGASSIHIIELNSPKELRDEGKAQDHCVGDYATACRSGESRIFSIRTNTGEILSTLELDTTKGNFRAEQNRGYHNKPPGDLAQKAAEWFLDAIKHQTISFNSDLPVTESERKSPIPDYVLNIGYVPHQEKYERAYQLFCALKTDKGKPFLSPKYDGKSLEELDALHNFTHQFRELAGFTRRDNPTPLGEKQYEELDRKVDNIKNALTELPPH